MHGGRPKQRSRPLELASAPCTAPHPPLPQSFAEKLAKLQAAESAPVAAAAFSLNFLWLDKNIAVAVDQVFGQVRCPPGSLCWLEVPACAAWLGSPLTAGLRCWLEVLA